MKSRILRAVLTALSLALLVGSLLAIDTRPEPVSSDGTKAVIDIPREAHMQNTGGSDGAGLCVPTSITVAARWHNLPDLYNYRKFTEGRPGGSYPEQTAADLKVYASRNKITLPPFIQHTGGDESFLDLCYATRRAPGITYAGLDNFYDSGIAHMVNGAHLDAKHGAIIDNNRAGSWVWMTRAQLLNRWKGLRDDGREILVPVRSGLITRWVPVGGGWAFVWLTPPPPPRAPVVADLDAVEASKHDRGPGYVWEREWDYTASGLPTDPRWMLYKDGELVWVVIDGKWHRATGPDSWEIEPQDKPDEVPGPDAPEPTQDWNSGIAIDKIGKSHRYWYNDVECSRAKIFALVSDPGANGLTDDSDRYHLSIVGADRAVVASWFAPGGPFEKYARRLHVQVYAPTDWPAKDRLRSVVTLQEPAKIGGKIAASGSDAARDKVGALLASVFDAPEPAPAPRVDPTPPVEPAPVEPAKPRWFQALLALVLGWLGIKIISTKGAK